MWWLLACRDPEPDPAPPPGGSGTAAHEVSVLEVEGLVESLVDGPLDGALPAGAGLLAVEDGTRRVLTAGGEWFDAGAGDVPDDAADAAGQLFSLSGGRVDAWVADGFVDAGFGGFLPAAPRALTADAGALWLETAGGLFRWRPDRVDELRVDGASVDALAAPGLADGARSVVWVAVGDEVSGFATNAAFVEGFERRAFEDPVDGLLLAERSLLVVEGGRLWVRDAAGWARQDGGERVYGVFGGPGGAWLRTEGGVRLWRPDAWWAPRGVEATDGRWWADDLGRLLVRGARGVDRVTLHRPLRVEGLDAGDDVAVARTIDIVATAPGELQSLALAVVPAIGDPVAVDADADGHATLDPAALPTGAGFLRVTAVYADQSSSLEVPFTVALVGDVTWERHVEPIHTARCARCHADSSNTVLDGPEAWEAHIDEILENVETGAMPLTGDPLPAAQVDLIAAWRDGGFR